MFPGFVNIYNDEENFVHLYFFNGIDDNDKPIYRDIDLSGVPFSYTSANIGGGTDYKFDNQSIVKIRCQLVNNSTGEVTKKILSLKK